jgi:hypothetical protein
VETAPLAIVTLDGADKAALLAVNTTVDDAGRVALSTTEQLPEPPGARVKGVQAKKESEPRAVNEIVNALELPFKVADSEAVWLDEKAPACAVNSTEDEPPGTVSPVWETVRIGLLLDTETKAVEPGGTGCVRFTVQYVDV